VFHLVCKTHTGQAGEPLSQVSGAFIPINVTVG
jgi:hypothetical protein